MITMDKIEKIRRMVKELQDEFISIQPKDCSLELIKSYAGYAYLDKVLSFLDTLSEEPDKDLEEAAEISFDEAKSLTEDYRDFLAKGLTENQPRPIGPHWFSEYAKNRFITGAEWQKEQMIKDAVEGEVGKDGILTLSNGEAVDLSPSLDKIAFGLQPSQKVRIVVLKEEE